MIFWYSLFERGRWPTRSCASKLPAYAVVVVLLSVFAATLPAAEFYGRFTDPEGGMHYGRVEGDRVTLLDAAPWAEGRPTGTEMALRDLQVLSPSDPHNIICLANAYKSGDSNPPKMIRWFAKSAGAAATDGDAVRIPAVVDQLKGEVEVVLIVGRHLANATEAEAREAIFGYTTGNELFGFAESFYRVHPDDPVRPEAMLAAGLKLGDRLAPFGPFIRRGTAWPEAITRVTIVREATGERTTKKNDTRGYLYTPERALSALSRIFTLEPGDVVFTGAKDAFVLNAGDVVTVEVEGLGSLTNRIVNKTESGL